MSEWLKKLPGYQIYEPGLEQKVLREFPQATVLGVLAIALPSLLARLLLPNRAQQMIDILVFATEIFFLSMVMTIAFAAFIIKLSKGPAYVAVAYPLVDSDKPKRDFDG
jgi:hypothetical protein